MIEDEARRLLAKLDSLREDRKTLEELAHYWADYAGGGWMYVDTTHIVRKRWPFSGQKVVNAEYKMTPAELEHFRDWAIHRYGEIDAEIATVLEALEGSN